MSGTRRQTALELPSTRSVQQATANGGRAGKPAMIRILIADDHEVVRSGLHTLLEARKGWTVVGEAVDGKDAVRKAIELKPDLAILDYALPLINGVEATRQIRAQAPMTEILVFTMHQNEQLIRDLFAAGARGYLLKSDANQHLYAAVESVTKREPFFTAGVSKAMLESYLTAERVPTDPLTNRERLIVQLIAEGKSNKEAASVLNITVKTVETHRAAIMRKLGFSSVAKLVRYAIRNKLVEP
jgi:DNA-binding NarL/FixJ family response regulator